MCDTRLHREQRGIQFIRREWGGKWFSLSSCFIWLRNRWWILFSWGDSKRWCWKFIMSTKAKGSGLTEGHWSSKVWNLEIYFRTWAGGIHANEEATASAWKVGYWEGYNSNGRFPKDSDDDEPISSVQTPQTKGLLGQFWKFAGGGEVQHFQFHYLNALDFFQFICSHLVLYLTFSNILPKV